MTHEAPPPSAQRHLLTPEPPKGDGSIESQLASLRHRLLRHARFAIWDDGLAEDLVQDTLIAVVEHHSQRRGDATLITWAMAILKNKVADLYRSADRRRIVYMDMADATTDEAIEALYTAAGSYANPVPVWQQPDSELERHQMMTLLDRCVSCLPRQAGRVFMMREWLGFETPEICQRLGVTTENCRTILHRARMSLRACMQRDWIGSKANA